MERYLRAGIAIFNEGAFHEAHDAWEDFWLDLDAESDDERFLHGLIQFTAAVHHAGQGNRRGATGLAESGRGYLADLPGTYREVNVDEVRSFLADLERNPTLLDREEPPSLTHRGTALTIPDLEFPATAVVAWVFAEEGDYDPGVLTRAIEYAEKDRAAGERTSPFVSLVYDFARDPASRDIAYTRLREHVQRRDAREADVDGLFDE